MLRYVFCFADITKILLAKRRGWNDQIISWCQKEAKRQNLRPEEYWGGLLLDEMKIQVHICMPEIFKYSQTTNDGDSRFRINA